MTARRLYAGAVLLWALGGCAVLLLRLPWWVLSGCGLVIGGLSLWLLYQQPRPILRTEGQYVSGALLWGMLCVFTSLFWVTGAPFELHDPWVILVSVGLFLLLAYAMVRLRQPRGAG